MLASTSDVAVQKSMLASRTSDSWCYIQLMALARQHIGMFSWIQ
jgi:hypothetical protein